MDSLGVPWSPCLPVNLNLLAPQILSFLRHDPVTYLQLVVSPPDEYSLVIDDLYAMFGRAFLHKAPPGADASGLAQASAVEMRGRLDATAAGELHSNLARSTYWMIRLDEGIQPSNPVLRENK